MSKWKDAESEFETRMLKEHPKRFLYKIGDTNEVKGILAKQGLKKLGFSKATPCDFIVVCPTVGMYFAEVKSCGKKTSFPFSNFQKTQIGYMKKTVRAGGTYTIFIKNTNTNKWYFCLAEKILETMETKKSLKWTEMSELIGESWNDQ